MKTRFGTQPVYDLLRQSDRSFAGVARVIDVPYAHLMNSVRGRTVPSHETRIGLAQLLDVPVRRLFTREVLAQSYRSDLARGGRRASA